MKSIITVLLLSASLLANGQQVLNVKALLGSGKIHIQYDLEGSNELEYTIIVTSSFNEFKSPLQNVSGDIGTVKPGRSKIIEWSLHPELPSDYVGSLSFEITAQFKQVKESQSNSKILSMGTLSKPSVRRGKPITMHWSGGEPSTQLKISLTTPTGEVSLVNRHTNNGSYSWQVPTKQPKGQYNFKVTSETGEIKSESFQVKARWPLIVKVIPIIILGSTVAILSGRSPEPSDNGDLSGPPTQN